MTTYTLRTDNSLKIVKEKFPLLTSSALKGLCYSYGIYIPYEAQKASIIDALEEFLKDRDALEKFYNKLPINHQKILKHIIFFQGKNLKQEIQKKFLFNIELPSKLKSKIQKYVSWLDLFVNNDAMDGDIKELFLSFLCDTAISQKSQNIEISDTEDINGIEVTRVTNANKPITQKLTLQKTKNIIESIHIFYNLLKAKKITVTQQNVLSAKTQKALTESLEFSLDEIYPFVSLFFNLGYIDGAKEKNPTKAFDTLIKHPDGDMMKHFLENFMRLEFQYEARVFPFPFSARSDKYIAIFRKDIVKIISTLNGNNWINCEYIVKQIPINEATLQQITNGSRYGYQANTYNSGHNSLKYLKTVVRYFIKGFISVLYRFGLCDIAQTKELSYFSEDLAMIHYDHIMRDFGNLEYFKLTDLGRYVFGFKQDYTSSDSYKLLLNSYSLDIVVENESNLSELFLANITTKISQNKYKTDTKTFTQQISSNKEFLSIKETFVSKTVSVPQNWLDFFSLLERRIVSLKQVTSSAILIKIPNDKEIVQLIATNQKLKQKIIKADNLHIVVLKENLQAVKIILKEQGIII